MKKRRESEGNMMEEAIEKASQLITLLQKENTELKRRVDSLEK
jgi:FtsZ-binding cell division protein ZapB